tara:strand:- start:3385 stop:4047 length:663 start_codon:yes stop_codon:yes gene_type:complete
MKKKSKPAILIHIKLNSQRLKGKNLKKIGKKPLLILTFDKLKKYKDFFDIYVHSSSNLIKKVSKNYQFNFLNRPKKLDLPNAQGNELISDCIKRIENKIIIQLFVTNPFIQVSTLKKIYKLLNNNSKIDSVTPVYPIYNRLWYNKKAVNHKYNKLVGTQFMKPVFLETGVYCFRKEIFKKEKTRVCKKNKLYKITELESFDIDTELDFYIASRLILKNKK